jgi:predicted CoA-binding protein
MNPFQKAKEAAVNAVYPAHSREAGKYLLEGILAVLEAHGYVLVPVEPSEGMLDAPSSATSRDVAELWRLMINAAKAERA